MLVSWPEEEDDVSVVSSSRLSGSLAVGEVCEFTDRNKKYPAKVHATGN